MSARHRFTFLVDFDGTACLHDASNCLLDRFSDADWQAMEEQLLRDRGGLRAMMAREAGMLRGTLEEMVAHNLAHCPMDPTFASFVAWADAEGHDVAIVSDGFGFNIAPLLDHAGIRPIRTVTNALTAGDDGRWRIVHPNANPTCDGCGTCKMRAVEGGRADARTAVFIGNGISDRWGAMHADVTFAKDALVTICEEDGTPFRAWGDFDDIRRSLAEVPPPAHGPVVGPSICPGWMPIGGRTPWVLRGADRPGDDERVLAVHAEAEQHDLGQVHTQLEDIRADWSRPSIDPERDALLVEDPMSGVVVAVASLERHGRVDAAVRPGARGRGIGSTLLRWAERETLSRAPDDGSDVAVGQTIADAAGGAADLLRAHGYAPFYTAWILRLPADAPAPDHAPPDGVELRAARWPDDAEACFRIIEDAFAHWPGRSPNTFENWAAWYARDDFDPTATVVAEDASGPVGVATTILPGEFWIQQVAVRVDRQGVGIGSAMLARAFRVARDRGYATVGLSTDSRTGALGVYERVGMRVTDSFTHHRKVLRAAR
ncbi:MAG: MtnX-like HAD-IB family phosphatase [Actinomycetota bacterium]